MPIIAQKTLDLIANCLREDQGNRFRALQKELLPLVEDAYAVETDQNLRSHLGASLIGQSCPRKIWYSWRWVKRPIHEGQLIRLFNRGHLEEARFVALLKMIGVEVWQFDQAGKQFRITGHKGHFGGGLDAVLRGVPDYPDTAILGEFKTHNEKSFTKLLSSGVEESKPEHYVQMNMYMGYYSLPAALYLAVNKNTDALYAEIVPFDGSTYQRFTERVVRIIDSDEAPPRINNSPAWYQCKFCGDKDICHGEEIPYVSCRSCAHVTAGEEGKWLCEYHANHELTKAEQLAACSSYLMNPTIKAKV